MRYCDTPALPGPTGSIGAHAAASFVGPIAEAVPAAAEPIAPSAAQRLTLTVDGILHVTGCGECLGGSPGTGAAAAPSGKFAQQAANSGGLLTWPPQFDRWQALPRSRDRTPRDCTYALA